MLGINHLGEYLAGTVAVIVLPGPNSMYCLAVAAQHGTARAYRAIAGVLTGDSILIFITVLGAGTLLKTLPMLFHGIKLIGGLYLAYIGVNLLRGAVARWRLRGHPESAPAALIGGHEYRRALMLSLTNPKAMVFLLSFFVQFVDPAYAHPYLSFFAQALMLQLISFAYLSVLAFSGKRLSKQFARAKNVAAAGMAAVGGLFIGFAVKLWTAVV